MTSGIFFSLKNLDMGNSKEESVLLSILKYNLPFPIVKNYLNRIGWVMLKCTWHECSRSWGRVLVRSNQRLRGV